VRYKVKTGNKTYHHIIIGEDDIARELFHHTDPFDQVIEVIESDGWFLQYNEEVPILLNPGRKYFVQEYNWHRYIKGFGPLIIRVERILRDIVPVER
jgi:hypothetical protein